MRRLSFPKRPLPDSVRFWILIIAVALAGLGAKWSLIDRYAPDFPYMDQWNGEGVHAIQPWANDELDLAETFLQHHNEHRIGWTRLFSIGLTEINGQWDNLFAASVSAIIHVAVIGLFLIYLVRPFSVSRLWVPIGVTAGFLIFPVAWENTLFAFQVQFYLLIGTGLLHIILVSANQPGSWRWCLGMACGLAGLACMSSAFVAPMAVLAMQAAGFIRSRCWTRQDSLTAVFCVLIAVVGILSVTHMPAHDRLRADSVWTFLVGVARVGAFPFHDYPLLVIFMQAPAVVWLVGSIVQKEREWTPNEKRLAAFIAFAAGHSLLIAYARGGSPAISSSRYTDIFVLLVLSNTVALCALIGQLGARARGFRLVFPILWTAAVIAGTFSSGQKHLKGHLVYLPPRWEAQQAHLNRFLETDDEQAFRAIPTRSLPFINHTVMINLLRDEQVRRVLPDSIRDPVHVETEHSHGFVDSLPDSMHNIEARSQAFYSDGSIVSAFRSAPLVIDPAFRVLRIHFAGHPSLPLRALRLETDDGREFPLEISGFAGNRWQSAHFFLPKTSGPVRLVAEAGPDGKFLAFAAPIEVSRVSWLSRQIRKESGFIFWAGIGLGLFGLCYGRLPALHETIRRISRRFVCSSKNRLHQFRALCEERPALRSALVVGALIVSLLWVIWASRSPADGLPHHLAALAVSGLAILLPALAVLGKVHRLTWLGKGHAVIVSLAVSSTCGYASFWVWFAHPVAGWIFCFALAAVCSWQTYRCRRDLRFLLRDSDIVSPLVLMGLAAVLYVSILHLFGGHQSVDILAGNRFITNMPADNQIPRVFAERLAQGMSPKMVMHDWLSSDRPPLQTGMTLMIWPWASLAGLNMQVASHSAGMWFQLLWVPAIWGLIRSAGMLTAPTRQVVSLTILTGFALFNNLYVWPKLSAAGLVITAFSIVFLNDWKHPRRLPVSGWLGALAFLAHGAVAFSIIGMAVLALARWPWPKISTIILAAGIFVGMVAPWTAYQKIYEPPGDRLLKWHLAGIKEPDERGVWEAIADAYGESESIWDNKVRNFERLRYGYWELLLKFDRVSSMERRVDEFFHFGRSLAVPILAAFLLPVFIFFRREEQLTSKAVWLLFSWSIVTVIVWCLLIFLPGTTAVHVGSLAANLTLITAFLCLTRSIRWWLFAVLAAAQTLSFLTTWLHLPDQAVPRPWEWAPAIVGGVALILILASIFGDTGSIDESEADVKTVT